MSTVFIAFIFLLMDMFCLMNSFPFIYGFYRIVIQLYWLNFITLLRIICVKYITIIKLVYSFSGDRELLHSATGLNAK